MMKQEKQLYQFLQKHIENTQIQGSSSVVEMQFAPVKQFLLHFTTWACDGWLGVHLSTALGLHLSNLLFLTVEGRY